MKYWTAWILLVLLTLDGVQCWDNDELEIFDLVEEVNVNFYTLLDVTEVIYFLILSNISFFLHDVQ